MRSQPGNRAYGLLIVALAIRALMPPGVMPVVAADGTISLAVCPGTSVPTMAASAAVDAHAAHALAGHASHAKHQHAGAGTASSEHTDHSGHARTHLTPCPFAVAACAAPAPALPALSSFVPLVRDATIVATSRANLPTIVR